MVSPGSLVVVSVKFGSSVAVVSGSIVVKWAQHAEIFGITKLKSPPIFKKSSLTQTLLRKSKYTKFKLLSRKFGSIVSILFSCKLTLMIFTFEATREALISVRWLDDKSMNSRLMDLANVSSSISVMSLFPKTMCKIFTLLSKSPTGKAPILLSCKYKNCRSKLYRKVLGCTSRISLFHISIKLIFEQLANKPSSITSSWLWFKCNVFKLIFVSNVDSWSSLIKLYDKIKSSKCSNPVKASSWIFSSWLKVKSIVIRSRQCLKHAAGKTFKLL